MWCSRWDDVSSGKGDAGEVVGSGSEEFEDVLGGDGKDLSVEDLASFNEGLDVHLVLEGANLQAIKKGGLTGGNLVSGSDDGDSVDDLDLSTDNLGLDVEGLEELSLLRVHSCGTWLDGDILGGESTNLGGGGSDLGVEDILNLGKISVGEDHTGVTVKVVTDEIEVGSGLPATEAGAALSEVGLPLIGLGDDVKECGLEVGVLTHDHLATDGTELLAHNANLLGGDVVDVDEHNLGVLKACLLEFLPTGGLHLLLGSLGHFVV